MVFICICPRKAGEIWLAQKLVSYQGYISQSKLFLLGLCESGLCAVCIRHQI